MDGWTDTRKDVEARFRWEQLEWLGIECYLDHADGILFRGEHHRDAWRAYLREELVELREAFGPCAI